MFFLNSFLSPQPTPVYVEQQPAPMMVQRQQTQVMAFCDQGDDEPPPPPSCCCCSVRTGTLIIGFLELIVSGIAILYLIYTTSALYGGYYNPSSSTALQTTTQPGWGGGVTAIFNWANGNIYGYGSTTTMTTTPPAWHPPMDAYGHYYIIALFFYAIVMIVASCLIFGVTRWRPCLIVPHIIMQILYMIIAIIIIIVIVATMASWAGTYTMFYVMMAVYLLFSAAIQGFFLLVIAQCYGYIRLRNDWLQDQMCGGGDTVIIAIDSGAQPGGYPCGNQVAPNGRRRRARQSRAPVVRPQSSWVKRPPTSRPIELAVAPV